MAENKLANKKEPDREVLSPEQLKAGEELFKKLAEELQQAEMEMARNLLQLYWQKGQFVADLYANPARYGNHEVEDLCDLWNTSETTLHRYQAFYLKYPKKPEVIELAKSQIAWRDIATTLTLPDDVARKLIDERKSSVITSDQLRDKVKKYNTEAKAKRKAEAVKSTSNKRRETKRVDAATEAAKSVTSVMQDLMSALDSFKDAYDLFQEVEEGKAKSDLSAVLQEGFKECKTLIKKLTWLQEYREKIVARKRAAAEKAKKK